MKFQQEGPSISEDLPCDSERPAWGLHFPKEASLLVLNNYDCLSLVPLDAGGGFNSKYSVDSGRQTWKGLGAGKNHVGS